MENKTAIEWLKQQFDFWGDRVWEHQNNLFEQAKAMEKKEHERIADKAREDGWRDAKYGSQRW